MKFDTSNWKEFKFGDLISDIYKSKALNKDDVIVASNIKKGIRYITRTGDNNGCELLADASSIEKEYIQNGNAITIGDTTATCFYQDERFITGDHMVVVRAEWLNETLALYILTILNKEQYKYSYGRAFLMDRIKNTSIKLPIKMNKDNTPFIDNTKKHSKKGYIPDWQKMEAYIKSLYHKPLTTKNKKKDVPKLKVDEWKEFVFEKIFNIKRGESLYITDADVGNTLYASASAENNGISQHLNIEPNREGNCLVINYDGSVGDVYYQPEPFFASEKIVTATYKGAHMNPYNALFIASVIKKEKYRFSYGRKWTVESSMKKSVIKLPIQHNSDGTPLIDNTKKYSDDGYVPDWEFMEEYIKALPYGDRL